MYQNTILGWLAVHKSGCSNQVIFYREYNIKIYTKPFQILTLVNQQKFSQRSMLGKLIGSVKLCL